MSNRIPTVFVADPDPSVRAALETLLRRSGWKAQLFPSGDDFLADGPRLVAGCLLLHVSAPDRGPDHVKRIAAERRETPIIAVSDRGSIPLAVQVVKAGAIEFLVKPLADDSVLAAVVDAIAQSQAILKQESDVLELQSRLDSLSHREREVMARVVAGDLNKLVGAALGISEITVKAHRGRVMRKMGARSLADLVRMALQLRLPPALSTFSSPPTLPSHPISAPGGQGTRPIRIMAAGRSWMSN